MKESLVQNLPQHLEWVGNPTSIYALDLFRGVAKVSYNLVPSIGRGRSFTSEERGSVAFGLEQGENHVVDIIQAEAPPYLDHRPETYLEWVVLAQHHGAATRLLDWTCSCLVALYFAVEKHTDIDGAVYLIRSMPNTLYENSKLFQEVYMVSANEYRLNEHNPTIAFVPRHISTRISAQLSVFTWHWDAYEKRPFTDEDFKQMYKNTELERIIIPATRKEQFRLSLSRIGFSHKTLFPGLSGICKNLGRD